MSFVIDRNLASWECFDVSTATTLFWKAVPVVHKPADREELRENFTVRILSGVTKNNHNLRVLRIYISTESDLLFLHTLEVTEEEFQGLKVEQGILVDFAHFPEKLITLLEKCMSSADGEFQAELATGGESSCLKIVETNDFNKLPRITLRFRPGSDHCVKSFLAFRLTEVDHEAKSFQTELRSLRLEHEKLAEEIRVRDDNWKSLKERYDTVRLEGKAESKRIHLEAEEKLTEQRESLKCSLDKERKDLEEKLKAQIEKLMTRNKELEDENRTLRDDKYALDRKCSELCHQLATVEGQLTSQTKESEDLRISNQTVAEEKLTLQTELNQFNADMRVLNEKLLSAEQSMESQRSRIEDLERAKTQAEKLCEELRCTIASCEKSGNGKTRELENAKLVIQKFASDLHMAKERQCKLRAIISCQEDAVSFQKKQLTNTADEKSSLEQTVEALRSENHSLKHDLADAKNKLKESADQLKDNENMIGWLHRQINDSAMHRERHQSHRSYQPIAARAMPESTSPFFLTRRSAADTNDPAAVTSSSIQRV